MHGPQRTIAALACASIEPATLSTYSTPIRKFQRWLQSRDAPKFACSEDLVCQYILYLHAEKCSYDSFKPVKAAITLYALCLGKDVGTIFTETLSKCFKGGLKLAWNDKAPTFKVPELELSFVKKLYFDFVHPFKDNIFDSDGRKFRCIFMMILEFCLLARCHDLQRLRAGDVTMTFDTTHGETAIFRFRHRKNDSQGTTTSLVLPNLQEDFNPVFITKLFFRRFNLRFGQDKDFHDVPLFHRFTCSKLLNSVNYRPSDKEVCSNTILKDMRKQLSAIQYPGAEKVCHNSLRCGGVTQAFEKGLDEGNIRDIGGWHNSNTPLRYRRKNIRDKTKNVIKMLSQK